MTSQILPAARLVAVPVLLLALGSCARSGAGDAVAPPPNVDLPLPAPPDVAPPPDQVDKPEPTFVEPRPGMQDAHPVAWDSAQVDREALTLTLTWWSGVEPCAVLDRVEIDYAEDDVTVTIFEGSDGGAVSCIMIAQYKAVTVPLEEDIGPRTLTDGALQ